MGTDGVPSLLAELAGRSEVKPPRVISILIVDDDAPLRRALPRIALACLAMATALWLGQAWLTEALAAPGLRYAALSLLVLIGFATYAAAVLATGALRLADVKAALRRRRV